MLLFSLETQLSLCLDFEMKRCFKTKKKKEKIEGTREG